MDVGGLGLGDRLINIEYGIANLPHSRLILVNSDNIVKGISKHFVKVSSQCQASPLLSLTWNMEIKLCGNLKKLSKLFHKFAQPN